MADSFYPEVRANQQTVPRLPIAVTAIRRDVAAAIKRTDLIGSRLMVAVSGGQDSLTLLDALYAISDDLDLDLFCCHFDHRLRGTDSDGDRQFVHELSQSLELKFISGSAEEEGQLSTEEAARNARYAFLARVSTYHEADAIAIGHTATDQAETILLNILRGSGLHGVAAMQEDASRSLDGARFRLFRPLLKTTRQSTEDYCIASGISPRIDTSNESQDFARNRVRKILTPLMKSFNPRVEESLTRLADIATQALEVVETEADRAWSQYVVEQSQVLLIDHAAASLLPAVKAAIVRRAFKTLRGDMYDLRQLHVEEVTELLNGVLGRAASLPGGLEAVSRDEGVVLRHISRSPSSTLSCKLEVEVPGEISLPGWKISALVVERPKSLTCGEYDAWTARLNPSLAEGELWVRGWVIGDRIHPLGMSGTKKLQDLFVDEKVPREARSSIPILACEKGIVWVAGHQIAEWAKVPSGSVSWLEVRAKRAR